MRELATSAMFADKVGPHGDLLQEFPAPGDPHTISGRATYQIRNANRVLS